MRLQKGFTVLMMAAQEGQEDIVKLLLKSGADKEAQDNVSYLCFRKLFTYCPLSFFRPSLLHSHHLLPPFQFPLTLLPLLLHSLVKFCTLALAPFYPTFFTPSHPPLPLRLSYHLFSSADGPPYCGHLGKDTIT